MSYDRGDVLWSRDPFKDDPDAGRPWLVLNNETHPFREEQSMSVALSTSGYEPALPIEAGDWLDGGLPRRSYALPWAVHSPRHRYVHRRIGRLTVGLVDRVVDALGSYVGGPR